MQAIEPFYPLSEALMSNLASRAHEWNSWAIKEGLFSLKKMHFRIFLDVDWKLLGKQRYCLKMTSSPSASLLERKGVASRAFVLKNAKVLEKSLCAYREKNSHGEFFQKNAQELSVFLTKTSSST